MFHYEEQCGVGVPTTGVLNSRCESVTPARCLIIDNDQTHQELVCLVMESLSLHPSKLEFTLETYQKIEAERPSLLVIDLAFGHRECWELLRDVQNSPELRQIPIILLSTDHRLLDCARSSFPFSGGVRCLQKPFDITEMECAVATLLSGESQD